MEFPIHQQIFEQLAKAKKVLIALPERINADATASALALSLFLKKLEKDADVASSGSLPENLKFLPDAGAIQPSIQMGKSLVVAVDTSQKALDEISYQTGNGKVEIFLKAKNGLFEPSDISFASEKFPVDVVVCLDCNSLEDLGRIFQENPDLFFETPKINIGHKPGNEYFGNINLVDVTASSVAEILAGLFEKFETQLVDEDIATCLLAGIIVKTNSFQHVQTTPRAFLHASNLVGLGGRQQEVVKHIFKTKSLSLLKLWGMALSKLKILERPSAAYSILSQNDFQKAQSSLADLPLALKELIDAVFGFQLIAILGEAAPDKADLCLALHQDVDVQKITGLFVQPPLNLNGHASGYKILQYKDLPLTLAAAENKLLEAVKSI